MIFYDKFDCKYYAGECLVTPITESINGKRLIENGVRLIPDNSKKLVFRLLNSYDSYDRPVYFVPMMVDDMSVIPDSVVHLIMIPKFGPIHTFPKNIKSVVFHDRESIIQNIPNMFMWPDANYLYYTVWQDVNISDFINRIKYIHDILPQPIYEEILEQLDITQDFEKY